MVYTGTGTQADPYIPEDFTGFLHCIAQTDSYVKLESDIDAALDNGYDGRIEEPVVFNCKECYADSLKKIIGVTVIAKNAIQIPSGTSSNAKTIRNIGFFNWSHKQVSDSATSFIKIGNYVVMSGCPVSAQSVGSKTTILNSYGNVSMGVSRCSFHVKFTNANSGNVVDANGLSLVRCNFILDGAAITISSYFFCGSGVTCSQVGVVVKNAVLTSGSATEVSVFGTQSTSGFNYLVFEDNCTGSLSADVSLKISSGTYASQGLTLYCTNNIEHLLVTENANCIAVSDENLKDADYLTEIGFFP